MSRISAVSHLVRRALGLCLIALLIVQLILPVQGVRAATTWTVNSLDGGSYGTCTTTRCTLNDAISLSSSGDTIVFDPALSGTILTTYIFIGGKTLTINGSPQVSISGNNAGLVFYIYNGVNLTLDGLTIQNGSSSQGGAIKIESSTLTLMNSTIKSSHASVEGGAIFNYHGTVIMTGSTLQNNSSPSGAGIYNSGGAVTVANSTFDSNTSTGYGGGILNSGSSLSVTNSTFKNNSAVRGGGIDNETGPTTVANSTFIGNYTNTSDMGGAIYHSSEQPLNVTNSTFTGNKSTGGGAIASFTTLNLINSTLAGNEASTGPNSGGADILDGGTLNFANSILANPVSGGDCAIYYAGTIGTNTHNFIGDGSCSPYLSGDPKLGSLQDNGGPTQTMALLPGSPAIDAGDDATCAAAPVNNLDQRSVTRPQGTHCDIGAFEYSLVTPTTTVLSSSLNPSTFGRTVVFRAAIAPPVDGGTVTFQDGGVNIPGCVDVSVQVGPVTEANCVVSALTVGAHTITAHYSGDAKFGSSTGTLSPNQQVNACASPITVTSSADGGAGTLRQAIADVCIGGTINFAAGLSGGTITLASTLTIDLDMTINGSALALPVTISGPGASCSDCFGVFEIDYATVTLDSLKITKGNWYQGGGINNYEGFLTLKNSTLSENTATIGGGIYIYGELTVSDSTISGNTATSGGGIYNNGDLTVSNSTLQGNTATDYLGGGIANFNNLTLTNSTLQGNSATSAGGLYTGSESDLDFANTIIAGSTGGDCVTYGAFISRNLNNLVQDGSCSSKGVSFKTGDPLLAPLANNGGPTWTMALLPGSPAIDAGDDATCAAAPVNNLDQRGATRPQGLHCDIGAYESNGPTDVSLASFTALVEKKPATRNGISVLLSWETTSEVDNLGFNLYRATALDGARVKLNAGLIPTLVPPGSQYGAVYNYTDTSLMDGKTYYYWLEAVDLHAGKKLTDPVWVKLVVGKSK